MQCLKWKRTTLIFSTMVKIFKIIEKVVYGITALAVVAVLGMLLIGIIANVHIDWARVFPLLYLVAAVCVLYKIVVISFSSFYQIQITRRKDLLDTLNPANINKDAQLSSEEISNKLDEILDAVRQYPRTDTDSIADALKERLPEVVQTLVAQQVEVEKTRLAKEYEQRMNEVNVLSADVSSVMERRSYLLKLEKEVKLRQEEDGLKRLQLTEEYTSLVFSLAGTPVEVVEKVCDVVKLFIQTGHISADKDLHVPLNKKLRNAELKQFVTNIMKYNQKENLDVDSFLQTAFGEWFSGKKENIAKNYFVLPKDSLVSKDGMEADLVILRTMVSKNE